MNWTKFSEILFGKKKSKSVIGVDIVYASVPADVPPNLILNGTTTGGFTLNVDEVEGDILLATTTG